MFCVIKLTLLSACYMFAGLVLRSNGLAREEKQSVATGHVDETLYDQSRKMPKYRDED